MSRSKSSDELVAHVCPAIGFLVVGMRRLQEQLQELSVCCFLVFPAQGGGCSSMLDRFGVGW